MRKFLSILLFCAFSLGINAQWVSPGNGTIYTFNDLVTATEGVVTSEAENIFTINADITISANDNLVIVAPCNIDVVNQVLITISGSIISGDENSEEEINITGKDGGYFNFRIDNAASSSLANTNISNCGGIKVLETDITFVKCSFFNFNTQYNTAVVNYHQCNPTFSHCAFYDNEGPAINSGANIMGSPKILNCYFYNNVTNNSNMPQLNLGPGAEDTIYIVGNHIEGVASDKSGGIAIADLVNVGATKAVISDNIIINNRYGYTQNGYTIDAIITGNQFINNNLETNPMNGGSGISIYGMSDAVKAKLRNNLFTGNLWGITAIYYHDIDLGTEEDPGNNVFYNNGNNGVTYELYNNAFSPISAIGNYWGSNDESYAETVIVHQVDDPGLGLVTFAPVMQLNPVFTAAGITVISEEGNVYFEGEIDEENHVVSVNIPQNYLNAEAHLTYTLPLGVTGSLDNGTIIDLEFPINITLSTPHGESQDWDIVNTTGGLSGDADGNGIINVADISTIIAYILEQNPQQFVFNNADSNSDGIINILDITHVVNIIMLQEK